MKRMTIPKILAKSRRGEKVTMLTAYDYPLARLIDAAGVDMILVGDSLANVVLGLESTRQVGMTEMLHHAKAVRRAVKTALLVGDMPYSSYQLNPSRAVANAKRFIKEAGCDAVKIEWFAKCPQVVAALGKAKIPVMGHVGLTPQTADKGGGFKVQGRDAAAADKIIRDAKILEEEGCFSIVMECIPRDISRIITQKLRIPTIGIGAGPFCDGQVLVTHDILGLFDRYQPKFVKKYVNLAPLIAKAVGQYQSEVRAGKFPSAQYSFGMNPEELAAVNAGKGRRHGQRP